MRGLTPFTSLTLFAQNLRFPGNLFIPPTYPRESQPGKGKEGMELFIQPTYPRESQPGKGKEGIKLFIQPTFPASQPTMPGKGMEGI